MNRSSQSDFRPASRRRGVTLVEMLVTVAVLIIIMTILVQVFQAATGALSAAQSLAQLDDQLRRLDGTIRSDLLGVTARFTPPLDPAMNLGYFEYGENEFADAQGEDSDDYIRFTAKAPPGRPFTGRAFLAPTNSIANMTANQATAYLQNQPVTITSEYAEIIYFLRNGNLYRRVLLVAPELQNQIPGTLNNTAYLLNNNTPPTPTIAESFTPAALGALTVSWQGANDLSARPSGTGPNTNLGITTGVQAQQTIILNSLGDLTNRENRFAYPRFANDFYNSATGGFAPDGIPDDFNLDNVPDVYPTFYPNIFNTGLINAPTYALQNASQVVPLLAFPYVFPGAYSRAQTVANYATGWIHSPDPIVDVTQIPGTTYQFDGNNQTLSYLQNMNHNPLDLGDNLNIPPNSNASSTYLTTWWGFPTWHETLSPYWNDPTYQINVNFSQPAMLNALGTNTNGTLNPTELSNGVVSTSRVLLPPMTSTWRPYGPQLSTDGFGDTTNLFPVDNNGNPPALWTGSWEDDLIMTGVRSFDVKAYDNAFAGYADLGWADDLRLYTPYSTIGGYVSPGVIPLGLFSQPITPGYTGFVWPPLASGTLFNPLTQTLAHEGRMPPLVEDLVFDARHGAATNYLPSGGAYTGNIGDDTAGVVRLRRVWDSWSTEYSRAPDVAVNNTSLFPVGYPWSQPVYPSYPAPYQAPLRGIQIQVRVVDPSNQRVKSITIVQDFTDKL